MESGTSQLSESAEGPDGGADEHNRRLISPAQGPIGALGRLRRGLTTEWHELGWIGRVALLGILLSLGIAITLGFTIPASARRHLLAAQTEIIQSVAADFVDAGLLSAGLDDPAPLADFDQQVRLRLMGGETVRVKLWSADGTVVYSDASELIGQQFPLTEPALDALAGVPSYLVSDLSDPAHALDRDMEQLIEFYIPITDEGGVVIGALELEQRVDSLATTLGHIQRNVWFSIAIGIGVLAVFMGSLFIAGSRAVNRRRRQAETLLGESLRAREAERKRIVGALHGDVGQPLYRLLYRIEGLRSKKDDPEVVDHELGGLSDLVRDIEQTLRAELRLLHRSEVEDIGLGPALSELVEATRTEADLEVDLELDVPEALSGTQGLALFWAAEEALINARKHSGASHVTLSLRGEDSLAVLEVADNGVGVTGPEGLGLTTIRERLDAIGGDLAVEPQRGKGTVVRAWVPLQEPTAQ